MSKEPRISDCLHLLQCPACHGQLSVQASQLCCSLCSRTFLIEEGIPRLFWRADNSAESRSEVTDRIKDFYEANPFPDYEDFDDVASLIEKARTGVFARLLDEQIPFGVRVLECGCGTGQLTNFLGIAHRSVIGTDISLASLNLAERFRAQHELDRVYFVQMNLFIPVFEPSSFDYVICNGVLHHTADPEGGFQTLSELLRPGGFLILGLYHRFGRLMTDWRRVLFRVTGNRFTFLDPRIRQEQLGETRRAAWFADQYQNPHESKHTISEVLEWIRKQGLQFVKSIPKTRLFSEFAADEKLFEPEEPGVLPERALKEGMTLVRGASEGGFFTVIARKP